MTYVPRLNWIVKDDVWTFNGPANFEIVLLKTGWCGLARNGRYINTFDTFQKAEQQIIYDLTVDLEDSALAIATTYAYLRDCLPANIMADYGIDSPAEIVRIACSEVGCDD